LLKDYTFQPIYSSADPDNFKRKGGSTQKGGQISQNETKYVKQSIKDPKTINEGVKINEILSG
jgi:hypothetical protein